MKTIKSLVSILIFFSFLQSTNAQCVVTSPCGNFVFEESVINVSSSNTNGVLTITVRNPEGVVIDEISCEESGVVSTSCTSLLPVELLSFTVKTARNKSVLLEWETGSEINNDYFEILHSSDGKVFKVIGNVKGALTTNEVQQYTFLDKQATRGVNFYKLRQVDTNGDFEDSEQRAVEIIISDLQTDSNLSNVDIAHLKSGIYWIRLDDSTVSRNSKLVKL